MKKYKVYRANIKEVHSYDFSGEPITNLHRNLDDITTLNKVNANVVELYNDNFVDISNIKGILDFLILSSRSKNGNDLYDDRLLKLGALGHKDGEKYVDLDPYNKSFCKKKNMFGILKTKK